MDGINVKAIYYTAYENELKRKVKIYESNNDYSKISEEYNKFADIISKIINIKVKEWIEIKINDYFDIVKINSTKIKDSQIGEYPLIHSSSYNNGIAKYIDTYSVDIPDCITVAMCNSAGQCFYQSGKFSITNGITILKLKEGKSLDLKLFAAFATYFLTKKYEWKNLTNGKLPDEIINYPIIEFTD